MPIVSYAWLLAGAAGHLALWVILFNRNHAMGLPRRVLRATEKLYVAIAIGIPVYWTYRLSELGLPRDPVAALFGNRYLEAGYFLLSCIVLAYVALMWSIRRLADVHVRALLEERTTLHDVKLATGKPLVRGVMARALAVVPCNQMTMLSVTEKTLAVAALDSRLDQLTIAHISDLHFTGKLTRDYFDYVIDRVNDLEPDLVVVTGDVVDKNDCVAWIPETLGRLQARHGKYFILGNHDQRVSDVDGLRKIIEDSGFTDLGSRCAHIAIDGCPILLAGNERPWFGTLPAVPPRDADGNASSELRVLLSHSPDQISWARQQQFDLMLAGHTHGGQIRLPLIGPMVSPSYYGVKYASGIFFVAPMLVHVSRGVSGLDPIRINCPPEITKLTLRPLLASNAALDRRHAERFAFAE